MSTRISFEARAWTPAEPHVVYALLADGRTWPTWSPIGSFRLEREGRDGGESEGAVRQFKTGAVTSREELLALEADETLVYSALSGLPLRDHRAEVTLAERDAGTAITWHESFGTTVPGTGWMLRRFLHRFVQRCADGLAKHAAVVG